MHIVTKNAAWCDGEVFASMKAAPKGAFRASVPFRTSKGACLAIRQGKAGLQVLVDRARVMGQTACGLRLSQAGGRDVGGHAWLALDEVLSAPMAARWVREGFTRHDLRDLLALVQ
jgi:hypothetical protein